jgi:tRNA (cmo5U34)-methyltransferase
MSAPPSARFDFDAAYGARYDAFIKRVFPGYEALFDMTLAHLSGALGDQADLLIVGSGSGTEIMTFGSRRPGWRFTGVDPSQQMVEIAGRRVREAGLDGRVRLHHGLVAELPAERAFDAATLICVMHFVPDDGAKQALLSDVAGRLRSGGALVLVDAIGEPGTPGFDQEMAAWMRYVQLRGLTPAEQLEYHRQVMASVSFITEPRIMELLRAAGFAEPDRFFAGFLFNGWVARRAARL